MTGQQRGNGSLLFMHKLETDFASMDDTLSASEWIKQQYNVSAKAGRGTYGKTFLTENVFLPPEPEKGIALRVGSQITSLRAISSAEVDTSRTDMFWGSYRATMKLSRVGGTCAAFFWYFNDTQEIDMEFLSREFDEANGVFPVNLVIHSSLSAKAGYDASKTGTFKVMNLTFDPTKDFHEYRFDYLPGQVYFYADGQSLGEMKGDNVPTNGGHVILQHWSNGNQLWSGGPPSSDAVILVKSVEAYFNSSDAKNREDWHNTCRAHGAKGTVCAVPETAPAAATGQVDDPSHDDGKAGSHHEGEENGSHRAPRARSLKTVLVPVVAVYTLLMGAPMLGLG
ncbi:Concanavalin A-like lectin/glucanase [Metarhizium album ARSEF 1941]|uniref:Concanavalin A-like lectin/glucanase n=1 Tax=Metarhizium album (strain ARSEF 1941) TaxID=1081103 RepID=A0A0B2X5Y1_METAS|nr:Concanavalin A-like lectin/glucanase [Metarhizium album ARSEF 1941]KHO00860.1 Concanavalin A-like lectin/glucanase [Metarhizium album ARSEF 1941]